MCGRSIAPMKLMHRLKHMKVHFEDKTRIQLSEYLELILWCVALKSKRDNSCSHIVGVVLIPLYRIIFFGGGGEGEVFKMFISIGF